jgi:hypothetical protein
MKNILRSVAVGALLVMASTGMASASEYQAKLEALVKEKLMAIAADPAVVSAVKAQNSAHEGYDAAKIDSLDKAWREEAGKGGGDMTKALLENALSKHLMTVQAASGGMYAEMFVMDNKGMNVGASNMTSDYMQGDEAKWQKTFSVGADAVLIDEVEQDESSGAFVSQVSVTVSDPESKQPIGAMTVAVDVEKLP